MDFEGELYSRTLLDLISGLMSPVMEMDRTQIDFRGRLGQWLICWSVELHCCCNRSKWTMRGNELRRYHAQRRWSVENEPRVADMTGDRRRVVV